MTALVGHDYFLIREKGGGQADVGFVPAGEQDRVLGVLQRGEAFLQLSMQRGWSR